MAELPVGMMPNLQNKFETQKFCFKYGKNGQTEIIVLFASDSYYFPVFPVPA
jgi:hypothetical protein